jgi:hypothetical protein
MAFAEDFHGICMLRTDAWLGHTFIPSLRYGMVHTAYSIRPGETKCSKNRQETRDIEGIIADCGMSFLFIFIFLKLHLLV